MQKCFQSKYLGSNSAEGLHFSAFHYTHVLVLLSFFIHVAMLAMQLFNMQKVQYSLLYHPLITGEKRL